jgi:hypothetical protein
MASVARTTWADAASKRTDSGGGCWCFLSGTQRAIVIAASRGNGDDDGDNKGTD